MRATIHRLLIVAMLVLLAGSLLVLPALPAHAAAPLDIRYISQYTGIATQNVDCGPASVAMILDAYGKRPNGWSNAQFVQDIRAKTGGSGDTGFGQLERALSAYGLNFAEIPNATAPQPDAQMQAMQQATAQGKPVIALVHGATLGRGQQYGDHWLVVRGFSDDGQSVFINDADNQAPRWAGWIPGGQITLSYATFRQAAYSAAPGPYGIIVGSGLNRGGPPVTPNGLSVSAASEHSLTLSWQASAGAGGYKIYRWGWAEDRWDFFYLATVSGTSYTQAGLDCGNGFNFYLVTAYNGAGESPHSGWVQGTTRACVTPATPNGLAVSGASPRSLTLSWQASVGADGYKIYRWGWAEDRWDFFYLATAGGTSYTQDGLDCASDFNFYLVTAYNGAGESPRSGWVQGTTQPCGAPATPDSLAISGASAHSLTLSWQASASAAGYTVYRWGWAEDRWDFFYLATTDGTSFTQDGLDCGSDFNFYLVTAYNGVGESPRSGWIQGTTAACAAGANPQSRGHDGPRPAATHVPPLPPTPPASPTPPPLTPTSPPPAGVYLPLVVR